MFETLDPDDPPEFGANAVSAVRTKARRMRRRKQAVTGVAAGGACAALVGTGLAVRWGGAFNRIDKVTVTAADPNADSLDRPTNILVVGWDSAASLNPAATPAQHRTADAVRLVRFDPESDTVTALTLPRDLTIFNPGGAIARLANYRTLDKITRAVERIGLPVDHAIGIDMEGFAKVVDSLGGVRLRLELSNILHADEGATIVDRQTGLRESVIGFDPESGDPSASGVTATTECRNWSGNEVLRLARSREGMIEMPGGEGEQLTDGDFGRQVRETELATALKNAVLATGFDLGTIDSLLSTAGEHLERDPGLGAKLLFQLGSHLAGHHEFTHLTIDIGEVSIFRGSKTLAANPGSPKNVETWKRFGSATGPISLDLPFNVSTTPLPSPTGPVLSAVPC